MDLKSFNSLILIIFCVSPNIVCGAGHNQDFEANFFKFVGDIAHAFHTAVCEFTCPPENRHKVADPNHVPSSNGCGSYGVQIPIADFPQLTNCCDAHDKCYDTCGSDKEACDGQFKSCLLGVCDKLRSDQHIKDKTYEGCKTSISLMKKLVTTLGCSPYVEAQKKACLCLKHKPRMLEEL